MLVSPNLMPEPGENAVPAPEAVELLPQPVAADVPRFPSWGWGDVVAVLTLTIFAVFVFSLVALGIARTFPEYHNVPLSELATNARVIVGAQAAAYPFVVLGIFLLVRSRSRQRFAAAIHWNWPAAGAPGFFLGGIVLAVVVESLSRFLPIPKSLPMDKYFTDASSAYLLAAFGLTLAPWLEELFFRGMLYPLLRRSFGVAASVTLTAAAFAAIHGAQLGYAWAPILSIFVVGVAFTLTRARTDSVAASFLMHSGYNFALFALLWLASDHFRHLERVTG